MMNILLIIVYSTLFMQTKCFQHLKPATKQNQIIETIPGNESSNNVIILTSFDEYSEYF